MRSRLVLTLVLVAGVASATDAEATLVYQKGFEKPSVWVAGDDGAGKRKLVDHGLFPTITPDGASVVFAGFGGRLREIPVDGGKRTTLIERWDPGQIVVSDDSRYVATLGEAANDRSRLVLIDRTSGSRRTVARGDFGGMSFSPASDRLAYVLTAGRQRPSRGTISIDSGDIHVAPVARGAGVAITRDGRSTAPVWGPERIAFSRVTRVGGRPQADLFTVAPDGSDRRRLAGYESTEPSGGLFGVDWSAGGDRFLAAFFADDAPYPVAVDPATSEQRPVAKPSLGLLPTALSRDGTAILAYRDPFLFDRRPSVFAIPYAGGKPTLLARDAFFPSWNR